MSSLINTCVTTAIGKDKTNPKGPKMKVNPNWDINVNPGSKFVFFFKIEGIII